MFGFGKLKFKGVDKKNVSDQAHIDDYNSAEDYGRVRLGKLGLYYKDLGKRYFVPYDYIENSFTRVNIVEPDDSPAYFYYRIILVHQENEFANILYEEEDVADKIQARLQEINPNIKYGIVPTKQSRNKGFFRRMG